jgi:peptide/nickel transport system ATP-binding protein/oligopeptide transport system ATP-binding protein
MNEKAIPLLEIKDLRTCFHTLDGILKAVDGIDFEVYQGETLGLVGESGCGKSVTALSILQLLRCPPAEIQGRILFEGQNLLELNKERIRQIRGNAISMIFQEPMTSLNPVLRIGEQISEAARIHKNMTRQEAWRWAVEMLQRVQIPGPGARSRQYPHKFSGGMRQRTMIAMALSCNPRLILADEPTTALDVTIQAQIMTLLQRLKDDFKTAIVLITHDLGVIAEMASRVVVMYAGKVMEYTDVKTLYAHPKNPYTVGLLESIPVMGRESKERRLKTISGVVPSLLNLPSGCLYNDRCPDVFKDCHLVEPEMYEVAHNHFVRCLKYA